MLTGFKWELYDAGKDWTDPNTDVAAENPSRMKEMTGL